MNHPPETSVLIKRSRHRQGSAGAHEMFTRRCRPLMPLDSRQPLTERRAPSSRSREGGGAARPAANGRVLSTADRSQSAASVCGPVGGAAGHVTQRPRSNKLITGFQTGDNGLEPPSTAPASSARTQSERSTQKTSNRSREVVLSLRGGSPPRLAIGRSGEGEIWSP